MSERAPYSRVYWSVVDDPKFVGVYDDDRLLATWLRLLLIADQSHPASANIPSGTHRKSVELLAKAGLVDLGTGSRYRIHGLDSERERRRIAATTRGPNGTPTGTEPGPNGIRTQGLRRDETSIDKTRQVPATPRSPERPPMFDEIRAAIIERYGPDGQSVVVPPTRIPTAAEQQREAQRKEAFELHEMYQDNRISEVEYQRRLRDVGKEPDDLTRLEAKP